MDFEPVGSASVSGAALRHAHQEALAQSASFTRRPVLFVDDAHTAVFAFTDGRHIAVRPAEKRLCHKKRRKNKLIVKLCSITIEVRLIEMIATSSSSSVRWQDVIVNHKDTFSFDRIYFFLCRK